MSQGTDRQVPGSDEVSVPPGSLWARLPLLGLVAALCGFGLIAWVGRPQPRQIYFSYLTAYIYFLSIALGALFFVLLQHAVRASWSVVVRRAAEHLAATLPLFALLFVPVALGSHHLFHWMEPGAAAADELVRHKQPYLAPVFFFARAGVYLVTWSLLGVLYRRRSVQQDRSRDPAITRRLQRLSAPALVLYGLTLTFAAFDWLMSLDPHWYSTIFGVYFFAGAVVAFFALLALLALGLRGSGPAASTITVEHLHDLGKLLFAFTCFWAYLAFSQFMLIWYANLPEETAFYLRRLSGSWGLLSTALAALHFGAPFLFLLPRAVKRSGPGLLLGACWMLVMHYADIYWLVMPNLHARAMRPHLLDLGALLAVGGLFVAAAGWLLRRAPVIPVGDPRLHDSLSFENR